MAYLSTRLASTLVMRLASIGLLLACCMPATAKPAPAAVPAGHVDDELLETLAKETRLNFLAAQASDLDIHLPPDKQATFFNPPDLSGEAARVAKGTLAREQFRAHAASALKKRREEIEQVFGAKIGEAETRVKQPHQQGELFVELLTKAVQMMSLPPEQSKPRMLLGKRLQQLFDADSERRAAKQSKKAEPAEHDQSWLTSFTEETAADLLKVLKPENRKELIRVWPTLFPGGDPPAPSSESAGGAVDSTDSKTPASAHPDKTKRPMPTK